MTDEPGYSPEEIERGDDKPGCHFPPWGCFLIFLIVMALLALLWPWLISAWKGGVL